MSMSSSGMVVVLGVETLLVLERRSLSSSPSTSVGVGDPKGMMVWLTNSSATGLLCLVVVWGTRIT